MARAMLFTALVIYPPEGFLQLKMFLAMGSKMGFISENYSSFSGPTMKVRVPLAAPVTPPLTGASMNSIPCFLAFWYISLEAMGPMVEQSMIWKPFLPDWKILFNYKKLLIVIQIIIDSNKSNFNNNYK